MLLCSNLEWRETSKVKKLLIFFVTFVITLSVNQTAFADESKNTSDESKDEVAQLIIKSQKEDIDNIVSSENRREYDKLDNLYKYKITGDKLSDSQMKELLEYKSEAVEKLKKELEEKKEKDESTFKEGSYILAFFFVVTGILLFIFTREE